MNPKSHFKKHSFALEGMMYVSVNQTQSSQFAFAEQAVLHALASATTPTSTCVVAALSIAPLRFRHSEKDILFKKYLHVLIYVGMYMIFFRYAIQLHYSLVYSFQYF